MPVWDPLYLSQNRFWPCRHVLNDGPCVTGQANQFRCSLLHTSSSLSTDSLFLLEKQGYFCFRGEVGGLGGWSAAVKTSVRRILREEGIYPKPTRPDRTDREDQPWDQFIKLHMNTLVACDFFSKAIWTPFGKRQAFALMFIHVGTRKVWVSPTTYHPDTTWVQQQGRNALMWLEDQGIQATHLIHDRDTKFTKAFDQLMRSAEIKIVKSPVKAPNANAFAEA